MTLVQRSTNCSAIISFGERSIWPKYSFRIPILWAICTALTSCSPRNPGNLPRHPQQEFRNQVAVSDVRSYLYDEPNSAKAIPQVRGTLRNLGTETLTTVELTLEFKNNLGAVIHEETAYPVFDASAFPGSGAPLGPGQEIKFAFKSPACPAGWEPGQLTVQVSKIVSRQ